MCNFVLLSIRGGRGLGNKLYFLRFSFRGNLVATSISYGSGAYPQLKACVFHWGKKKRQHCRLVWQCSIGFLSFAFTFFPFNGRSLLFLSFFLSFFHSFLASFCLSFFLIICVERRPNTFGEQVPPQNYSIVLIV